MLHVRTFTLLLAKEEGRGGGKPPGVMVVRKCGRARRARTFECLPTPPPVKGPASLMRDCEYADLFAVERVQQCIREAHQ